MPNISTSLCGEKLEIRGAAVEFLAAVGKRAGLGNESGQVEAWAYPKIRAAKLTIFERAGCGNAGSNGNCAEIDRAGVHRRYICCARRFCSVDQPGAVIEIQVETDSRWKCRRVSSAIFSWNGRRRWRDICELE
jgi:hypothetical protein